MKKIGNDWDEHFQCERKKEYFKKLEDFLDGEYKTKEIFPPRENVFQAFKSTPYSEVKVVILGQDPYHGVGQSHGLAFSVGKNVKIPPSLRNIYKELSTDLGCFIPNNGHLASWAEQGVLLLNAVFTVVANQPNSHRKKGWEEFTESIISHLNNRDKPMVFILWGNNAKEKIKLIHNENHLILTSVHPSPLSASRGFFGCKHFSKANDFLIKKGIEPINWQIPNI